MNENFDLLGNKMNQLNADSLNPDNCDGFIPVRKKPIVVHARRMDSKEGFFVTTLEGTMLGKPGDYLMFGVDGEKYPIDKKIFEKTYDIVEE